MNWQDIVSNASQVGGVFGLLGILGSGYYAFFANGNGSVIEKIAGKYNVSPEQITSILALFKDDEARLKALKELLNVPRDRANDVLKKLKSAQPAMDHSERSNAFKLLVVSIVVLVLSVIGLVAASIAREPIAPIVDLKPIKPATVPETIPTVRQVKTIAPAKLSLDAVSFEKVMGDYCFDIIVRNSGESLAVATSATITFSDVTRGKKGPGNPGQQPGSMGASGDYAALIDPDKSELIVSLAQTIEPVAGGNADRF